MSGRGCSWRRHQQIIQLLLKGIKAIVGDISRLLTVSYSHDHPADNQYQQQELTERTGRLANTTHTCVCFSVSIFVGIVYIYIINLIILFFHIFFHFQTWDLISASTLPSMHCSMMPRVSSPRNWAVTRSSRFSSVSEAVGEATSELSEDSEVSEDELRPLQ